MQEPIYFVSGFYFPIRSLGAFLGGVGSLIPLGLGLDAMRQFVLPGAPSFIPTGWEVLILVGQTLLYGVLSQVALRYLEQRARHDARLLLRSS
jgi:ABC-2 type transport system permease protein